MSKKNILELFPNIKSRWIFEEKLGDSLLSVVRTIKKPLNDNQKKFIKFILDYYTKKTQRDGRFLSILYRKMNSRVFFEQFKDGYSLKKEHLPIIKKHLTEYNSQDKTIYKYTLNQDNDLFFVLGKVKFLEDFIFEYINRLKNINVVDTDSKRVFFRKTNDCSINIKNICEQYCNGSGNEYECSGNMTEKFLKLSKLLLKYE